MRLDEIEQRASEAVVWEQRAGKAALEVARVKNKMRLMRAALHRALEDCPSHDPGCDVAATGRCNCWLAEARALIK